MDKFKGIGKSKFTRALTYFLFLNAGILMLAVGIYFFKAPNGFATGGVSGISIILAKITKGLLESDQTKDFFAFLPDVIKNNLTQSVYMLIINTLLLVVGVIILGKKCGALTFYCSLMMSAVNFLLERFVPVESIPGAIVGENGVAKLTGQPMLELVFAVMLTGIGSAILFKCNASSGGTDIVALILKKYTSLNVGTALLITDALTAASTIFIFGVEVGLFSMLGLFAKVFVVDDILDSMNMCKAFTIITTKPDEITEYIMNNLKHGATIYDAKGAYSGEGKNVIITV